MERRHQVFISSTFTDLKDERAEVVQALLELDCFPAGMELFPATSEAAWDLIRGVIDDSDYYCLIISGRYGSLDATGISFTEKEYDYAVSSGKPVVAFLHSDPGASPASKTETSDAGRELLTAFRKKVEAAHHCKYWNNAEDLGGKVSRAIIALKKSHPSDGWVPGAYAADEASRLEVATLRTKVAELEAELAKRSANESLPTALNLASGDDIFRSHVYVSSTAGEGSWREVLVTWDQVLSYVGPTLLPECSDEEFLEKLNLCFGHAVARQKNGDEDIDYSSVILQHVVVDQIKVQLRALGYMVPGTKRRAVSDKKTYWKLSSAGEARLLTVQAIQKPQKKPAASPLPETQSP
jgi:hypothetical protein